MSVNFKTRMPQNVNISAHCGVTNPETMGYPYLESIKSFASFCREVIVVDGGSTDGSLEKISQIPNVRIVQGERWDRDFDWKVMGRNLQIGFSNCKGDWVFRFDVDYIFHENYIDTLKEELVKVSLPTVEVAKWNFVLVNELYEKGYFPWLVNKKEYPIICYGIALDEENRESATYFKPIVRRSVGDDGLVRGEAVCIERNRVHRTDVPIYTYDFTFMTKEQVIEQRHRFANALDRFKGGPGDISKEVAFEEFINMMKAHHTLCQNTPKLTTEAHSAIIKDKVNNITPEMFGFGGFGLII